MGVDLTPLTAEGGGQNGIDFTIELSKIYGGVGFSLGPTNSSRPDLFRLTQEVVNVWILYGNFRTANLCLSIHCRAPPVVRGGWRPVQVVSLLDTGLIL